MNFFGIIIHHLTEQVYSFNLGVIARPTDFLRLGVAYNSPTWYKMTNYYSAEQELMFLIII